MNAYVNTYEMISNTLYKTLENCQKQYDAEEEFMHKYLKLQTIRGSPLRPKKKCLSMVAVGLQEAYYVQTVL